MSTTCYAMVRGSAIRVTGLTSQGTVPAPILFATSKSVAVVRINEVTESSASELLNLDGEDNVSRVRFDRPEQTIRYTADVDFLRVDPGALNLVVGTPTVANAVGDIVGFDANTRVSAASFALELWSRLAGADCADGTRQYGYTVLPFLKGGYLTGFEFKDGLVSFKLRNAQARKSSRWGVGPWDLEGTHERLVERVSGNTLFRTFVTTAVPPVQGDGIQEATDVIEGGTATLTTSDIIDGEFVDTSLWIVEGGSAA